MAPNKDEKLCVKCKKALQRSEMVLVCGLWCRKYFHNYCVGLSINEAHAVKWSKERIKFHCEACENRLGIEVYGATETYEPKKLQNCVNSYLMELAENILKLTNKLTHDNSEINAKLETVLGSNARLEASLLQAPRCFEKQSEGTSDNSVEYVPSYSTKGITEIREGNDDSHFNNHSCASDIQQTDDGSLHIVNDVPKQITDSVQQNVAEGCSSNDLQVWEVPVVHISIEDPLSADKECAQEWEIPDAPNGMPDPLSIDREDCPPSEDLIVSNLFTTRSTEDEEDVEKSESSISNVFTIRGTEDEEKSESNADKEDCPPSENILVSNVFTIGSPEDEEDVEKSESNTDKEDCSSAGCSTTSTLNTEKTGDQEDEEAVRQIELEELKHEVESVVSDASEPESGMDVDNLDDGTGLVTNISVDPETSNRIKCITKRKPSYGNKIGRRYRCHICKNAFGKLQELKAHTFLEIRGVYSCCMCGRTYTNRSNLNRHFLVHTGERPYTCSVCKRTFTHSSYLKNHFSLHTGERPHVCVVCNNAFRDIAALKQHLRLHSGERPYACAMCTKTFTYGWALKRHLRSHTGKHTKSCESYRVP